MGEPLPLCLSLSLLSLPEPGPFVCFREEGTSTTAAAFVYNAIKFHQQQQFLSTLRLYRTDHLRRSQVAHLTALFDFGTRTSSLHQERRLQSTTTPGSCVYRTVICRSPFNLLRLRSAALQRSRALFRSTPSTGCYVIGDAVMISRSVMISVNFQGIKLSLLFCVIKMTAEEAYRETGSVSSLYEYS